MINSVDERTRTKWLKSKQTSHRAHNRRDIRCSIQYNKSATVLIVPYERINSHGILQMNSTHKHFNAGIFLFASIEWWFFVLVPYTLCKVPCLEIKRNIQPFHSDFIILWGCFIWIIHQQLDMVTFFYCAHFCLVLSKYLLGFVTTSRYGNAFGISDPLWREFTGHRGD